LRRATRKEREMNYRDVTEAVEAGTVVKRVVGFGREGYVAEVTAKLVDGLVTVRGEALTEEFALMRAKATLRGKLTARKRATGFTAEGLRERTTRAGFDLGFGVT
jgi:hypothetical protein